MRPVRSATADSTNTASSNVAMLRVCLVVSKPALFLRVCSSRSAFLPRPEEARLGSKTACEKLAAWLHGQGCPAQDVSSRPLPRAPSLSDCAHGLILHVLSLRCRPYQARNMSNNASFSKIALFLRDQARPLL